MQSPTPLWHRRFQHNIKTTTFCGDFSSLKLSNCLIWILHNSQQRRCQVSHCQHRAISWTNWAFGLPLPSMSVVGLVASNTADSAPKSPERFLEKNVYLAFPCSVEWRRYSYQWWISVMSISDHHIRLMATLSCLEESIGNLMEFIDEWSNFKKGLNQGLLEPTPIDQNSRLKLEVGLPLSSCLFLTSFTLLLTSFLASWPRKNRADRVAKTPKSSDVLAPSKNLRRLRQLKRPSWRGLPHRHSVRPASDPPQKVPKATGSKIWSFMILLYNILNYGFVNVCAIFIKMHHGGWHCQRCRC